MGDGAWGPVPKTQSQIIADLQKRVALLEARRQFYKVEFNPQPLVAAPEDFAEYVLSFPGVKVGDAVVIAYPPSNPTLEVAAVVESDNSVFVTIYNPSTVTPATLTGTWTAFRLA